MKKYIVLDLDETLVHTFTGPGGYDIAKKQPHLQDRLFSIKLDGDFLWGLVRPYARDLIINLQKYYEVGVWSAGTRDYVLEIVKILFPPEKPPVFIWSREYCEPMFSEQKSDPINKKPLTKLYLTFPQMDRTNTLIIDDRNDVCDENHLNHICIPEYSLLRSNLPTHDSDISLLSLNNYLVKIKDVPDVRYLSGFRFDS